MLLATSSIYMHVLQKDVMFTFCFYLYLTSFGYVICKLFYFDMHFYNKFMKFSFKFSVGDQVRNWHDKITIACNFYATHPHHDSCHSVMLVM
jgi:hypothetical protein